MKISQAAGSVFARFEGAYVLITSRIRRIPKSLTIHLIFNKLTFQDSATEFVEYEGDLKARCPVKEGWTVLDVGANVGGWAIWLSRQVGHGGRVVALEPGNEAYSWLVRYTKGLGNVAAFRVAAWNTDTHLHLEPGHLTAQTRVGADPGAEPNVRAYRIDTLVRLLRLSQVDMIKIDVEGAEEKVLEGATKTAAGARAILVEVHRPERFPAISQNLRNQGFKTDILRGTHVLAVRES